MVQNISIKIKKFQKLSISLSLAILLSSCEPPSLDDNGKVGSVDDQNVESKEQAVTWKSKFPALWSKAYASDAINPKDITYSQLLNDLAKVIKENEKKDIESKSIFTQIDFYINNYMNAKDKESKVFSLNKIKTLLQLNDSDIIIRHSLNHFLVYMGNDGVVAENFEVLDSLLTVLKTKLNLNHLDMFIDNFILQDSPYIHESNFHDFHTGLILIDKTNPTEVDYYFDKIIKLTKNDYVQRVESERSHRYFAIFSRLCYLAKNAIKHAGGESSSGKVQELVDSFEGKTISRSENSLSMPACTHSDLKSLL